jgi:hypothetical protein
MLLFKPGTVAHTLISAFGRLRPKDFLVQDQPGLQGRLCLKKTKKERKLS